MRCYYLKNSSTRIFYVSLGDDFRFVYSLKFHALFGSFTYSPFFRSADTFLFFKELKMVFKLKLKQSILTKASRSG